MVIAFSAPLLIFLYLITVFSLYLCPTMCHLGTELKGDEKEAGRMRKAEPCGPVAVREIQQPSTA